MFGRLKNSWCVKIYIYIYILYAEIMNHNHLGKFWVYSRIVLCDKYQKETMSICRLIIR